MDARKRKLLVLLAGALLMVIAAGSFVVVNGKMQEKNYNEAISIAEKCLLENDYETAILHYEQAIELEPEDVKAYLGLADVYVKQENYSRARAVLKHGLEMTASPRIELLLNKLYSADGSGEPAESDEIQWDSAFLQKIGNYTFREYKEEFGSVVSMKTGEDGYLEVVHSNLDGVCLYRNTADNNKIVDISRKTPYIDAMPEKIRMNSITPVFRNFEGGISIENMQMLVGEMVRPEQEEERNILEIESGDCILRVETDGEGNITSEVPWNEIILLNANQEMEKGKVAGVVLDAVTGKGVAGAMLAFEPRDEDGQEETDEADGSGSFSTSVAPGRYTIVITAEGYIEEEFDFNVREGKSYIGEEFVISPDLAEGTARIVLEWNASPRDLDSFLVGDTDDGHDVNVNFRNKDASADGEPIANLDLDDINGYGPETTTIYDLKGTYVFSVEDFHHTGTMAQHGATVKVYLPGRQPKTISLSPESGVVDEWLVCEIDHGKLTVLDRTP